MALAPAFVISPVATTAPVATAGPHVGSQRSGGFASTGAGEVCSNWCPIINGKHYGPLDKNSKNNLTWTVQIVFVFIILVIIICFS